MKATFNLLANASTSFDQAERESLQAGRWRVDCVSIELRQCSVAEPQIYFGPGYLFQNEAGQLSAKIYATETKGTGALGQVLSTDVQAGDLLPETWFYDAIAQDNRGRLWKSERTDIASIDHGTGGNPFISVSFDELWCEAELPIWSDPKAIDQPRKAESSSFHFTVFETLEFPKNASVEVKETVAG